MFWFMCVLWKMLVFSVVVFFKQKTAYEMLISDWSSDECSSDLEGSIVAIAKRMVGAFERHETLGMAGGEIDARHIVDADHRVGRRMEQQQRPPQCGDEIGRASCRERVCQYV